MAVASDQTIAEIQRRLLALRDEVDALLDCLEDVTDVEEADETLAAIRAGKEKTFALEDVIKQLDRG